jgi:hypothetical protein
MIESVEVLSSSGGTYKVDFTEKDGALKIFCHCEAGIHAMMCKHKIALGLGDASLLAEAKDAVIYRKLTESPLWPAFSKIFTEYDDALKKLDRSIAQLKRQQKQLKEITFHNITF